MAQFESRRIFLDKLEATPGCVVYSNLSVFCQCENHSRLAPLPLGDKVREEIFLSQQRNDQALDSRFSGMNLTPFYSLTCCTSAFLPSAPPAEKHVYCQQYCPLESGQVGDMLEGTGEGLRSPDNIVGRTLLCLFRPIALNRSFLSARVHKF